MNKLFLDWIDFCENKKTFDKSHFYTLFWENIDVNTLKIITQYFPNSGDLFIRLNDYFFGDKYDLYKLLDKSIDQTLIELSIKDFNEKLNIILEENKQFEGLKNLSPLITEDYEYVQKKKSDHPYIDFFDELEFKLTELWVSDEKKFYALYEAFYGLTKSYEMSWYLFKPLLNVEYNFKYYYNLTRIGGVYAIDTNNILIARDPKVSTGLL